MNDSLFPADMFLSDTPDREWSSLKEQTSAAAMKRIDLSYYVYLQQTKKGASGAIERTALALGIQGEDMERGLQVVGDNIKIFKLFRTPVEHGGLGYTRDSLAQHSFRRLRAFAQNKDWSRNNLDKIPEMLAQKDLTEEKIREQINKDRGTTAKTATSDRMKLRFDFTLQDGLNVEEVLKAALRRREKFGEPLPTADDSGKAYSKEYLAGIILQEVVTDWLMNDSGLIDDAGNPILNVDFFLGGRFATDEEPDASAGEQTHSEAAD